MARRRLTGGGGGADDDVNVTPLLDIVFIMLIFFIVTSTFVKEPGIEIERPEADTATERRLATILVAVSSENEIWINKEQVELDEVRLAVEALARENPKGTAAMQVDARSDARFLIEVADQIRAAGVNEIAVSTEEN